jgi:hypothetical protein
MSLHTNDYLDYNPGKGADFGRGDRPRVYPRGKLPSSIAIVGVRDHGHSELTSVTPPADLGTLRTNTASGKERASYAYLEVRVQGKNELIPWQTIRCHVHGYKKIPCRLFRGKLETNLFMCNHPRLQRLYVAHSKAQLINVGWLHDYLKHLCPGRRGRRY